MSVVLVKQHTSHMPQIVISDRQGMAGYGFIS